MAMAMAVTELNMHNKKIDQNNDKGDLACPNHHYNPQGHPGVMQ